MDIEHLKADAINIMNGLGECWAAETAIPHTADVLVRIYPGINRELLLLSRRDEAGWP